MLVVCSIKILSLDRLHKSEMAQERVQAIPLIEAGEDRYFFRGWRRQIFFYDIRNQWGMPIKLEYIIDHGDNSVIFGEVDQGIDLLI